MPAIACATRYFPDPLSPVSRMNRMSSTFVGGVEMMDPGTEVAHASRGAWQEPKKEWVIVAKVRLHRAGVVLVHAPVSPTPRASRQANLCAPLPEGFRKLQSLSNRSQSTDRATGSHKQYQRLTFARSSRITAAFILTESLR